MAETAAAAATVEHKDIIETVTALKRTFNSSGSGSRTTRRAAWLGAVVVLVSALVAAQLAAAEHAQSEVWSEADGLQMKYSTDHDDMIGAKGSELSLSSNQQQKQGQEQEATGAEPQQQQQGNSAAEEEGSGARNGGTSSSESSGESSGGGSSDGDSSSGGGGGGESSSSESSSESPSSESGGDRESSSDSEQGADTSRQTDRVPLTIKQHAAAFGASHKHQQQQRFREPSVVFRGADAAEADPEETGRPAPKSSKSSALLNYNAAMEQAEDGSETANVDHGNDDEDPYGQGRPQPDVGARFRQPGRHFKAAARITMPADKPKGAETSETSSGNNDEGSSSSGADDDESGGDSSASKGAAPSAEDGGESNGGEHSGEPPEFAASSEKSPGAAFRARQNMIDFDRVVDTRQRNTNSDNENENDSPYSPVNSAVAAAALEHLAKLEEGEERPSNAHADDDGFNRATANKRRLGAGSRPATGSSNTFGGPPPPGNDEFGFLHSKGQFGSDDHSPAHARQHQQHHLHHHQHHHPMAGAGSTAHKERLAPTASGRQQQASAAAPNSKQAAYKQLAYFKSVHNHQHDLRGAVPAQQQSPDSVRDNFISPGHYPGSMSHLTQAASEHQKKELVLAAAAEAKKGAGTLAAAASDSSQLVAAQQPESQLRSSLASSSAAAAAASDTVAAATSFERTSSSTTKAPRTEATPETPDTSSLQRIENDDDSGESKPVVPVTPEPEAQPESQQIMAPVLMSTTTMAPLLPTTSTEASAAGSNGATATTTQAPTLKRFKFRKYR